MKKSFGGIPARPIVKWGFAALLAVFVLAALVLGGFPVAHAASDPFVLWKDKTVPEQYPEMMIDGKQYKYTLAVKIDPLKGPSEIIGESVGNATAFGYDEEGLRREKACSVYLIKSLSEDYALAVKYEKDKKNEDEENKDEENKDEDNEAEKYFIFVDKSYAPSTLGDFITDANLLQNLVFDQKSSNRIEYIRAESKKSTITYRFPKTDDITAVTSKISDLLRSNASAKIAGPENREEHDYMRAFVSLDVIGNGLIDWVIYPDGYIIIKTPECSAGFYIGEDEAKAFIDYVQAHGVKDGSLSAVNKIVLVVAIIALVIFAAVFMVGNAREEARSKPAEEPSK